MLCACLLVIFLSFISLDLALIAGVAVTLAAFFDATRSRSNELEHFLQNHLHSLSARQTRLEATLGKTQEVVQKMEQDIAQTKKLLDTPPPAPGFSFNEIIPAFLKPQGWSKPAHTTIEDEEDEEDSEPLPLAARRAPVLEPEAAAEPEDQSLSDMVVRELVHHAVRHKRIDVFMQPIMRLPQRQVKFYEMFARIRAKAGVYLPAGRYMDLAAEENIMTAVDNLLLLHGLQALRKNRELQRQASFFLNIKPQTLRSSPFMRDLLDFLKQNRDLAPCLIFELRQDDFDTLSPPERKILAGLAALGCALSLDHVETIPEDVRALEAAKIRFIKLQAQTLLAAARSDRAFADMLRLKRKLEANGIGVIIEKIETEAALLELLDFNINYGQGFLFGRPDLQGVYARRRAS